MQNKIYTRRLIGAFVLVMGVFALLLAITNLFNNLEFIQEYKTCINVANYTPALIDTCKANVSDGLGITIRSNQIDLTPGQYMKVYFNGIIEVLFSVLLIIIGYALYNATIIQKQEIKAKPKKKKR
jgi:hypothetical protein